MPTATTNDPSTNMQPTSSATSLADPPRVTSPDLPRRSQRPPSRDGASHLVAASQIGRALPHPAATFVVTPWAYPTDMAPLSEIERQDAEDFVLTAPELRALIEREARELGLGYDEAVAAERADRLPATVTGTDLTFLIRLERGVSA